MNHSMLVAPAYPSPRAHCYDRDSSYTTFSKVERVRS